MGASGLARPPLAQLLFVRIRFAPAHHPWGAHGRHFKNSAASKNQIYGIKNWSGRADLNGRERARAAAPRTAFVCAHPLRSCASPLGCSWSALQKFCRLQKSDLWDKELVGTGRFELPTPRTPSECSTRLSHVPTIGSPLYEKRGVHSERFGSIITFE